MPPLPEETKLHLLTIVVQRKLGEAVLDAALKAGATGATFFYAQGTGVRQKLGLMGMFVEAEKQVVFVVTDPTHAESVMKAVTVAGKLDQPGQGFAYVQEVIKTVGFTGQP